MKIKLSRIFCSIFLLCICVVSAQKYTIKYVDAETQKPIENLKVISNFGEEKITDTKGVVYFENQIIFIEIKDSIYYPYKNNLEFNGFHTIELFKLKSINIPEIILKKPKIIYYGNVIPKNNRGFLSCKVETKTMQGINEVSIYKRGFLNSYNFHIESDSKYNIPFNFILYESENGKPGKEMVKQLITDYSKGSNFVSLINLNIYLEPGNYFVAMQWVFPSNEETFREIYKNKEGNPIIIYGQQLSVTKNFVKNAKLKSYMLKEGKFYNFESMYSQGISILTKE